MLRTIPRLLHLDHLTKLTERARDEHFTLKGLNNGTDLAKLRRKEENRDKQLVEKKRKEDLLWNARDLKKKNKRDESRAARLREQTQGQRTMQEYFERKR